MHKRAILVVLAIAALTLLWTAQASACRGASRGPGALSVDDARRAVACLINRRRAHHGLRRLHASAPLGVAAQEHSDAMASMNFFSHDGNDGTPTSRAQAAGYTSGANDWGLGENLEWGSGKGASPRAIVRGWMHSAVHRSVMLSRRFRHFGVGVTQGSPMSPDVQNAAMFTVDFGFRKG